MIPLKTQAIQTALLGDWESAITLNLELLKENADDIETLNRLAYAYSILGKIKEAKETYKKVLELDAKNPIALKNLRRISSVIPSSQPSQPNVSYVNSIFLEEDGKTKVMELVNLAEPKIISVLHTGELLPLQVKRLKIFALDKNKQYVGMLPDDIAKRLIRFIDGGNLYDAYIKSVNNSRVIVFVKETKRANRFKNQPSFLSVGKKNMFGAGAKNNHFPKSVSDPESEEE